MKISRKDALVKKVDGSTTIEGLFDGKDFAFDVVIGNLNGQHPTLINHVSDRAYFILRGELTISVGEDKYSVVIDDLVTIPKNTPHSLCGNGTYLIITAPPYDPKNEEKL